MLRRTPNEVPDLRGNGVVEIQASLDFHDTIPPKIRDLVRSAALNHAKAWEPHPDWS